MSTAGVIIHAVVSAVLFAVLQFMAKQMMLYHEKDQLRNAENVFKAIGK